MPLLFAAAPLAMMVDPPLLLALPHTWKDILADNFYLRLKKPVFCVIYDRIRKTFFRIFFRLQPFLLYRPCNQSHHLYHDTQIDWIFGETELFIRQTQT